MQRWQEQTEQKLVELLRTRRSFAKMQLVWLELARIQPSHCRGAAAYARQKAAMYQRRTEDAARQVEDIGHGKLLEESANAISFVDGQRRLEAEYIARAVASGS